MRNTRYERLRDFLLAVEGLEDAVSSSDEDRIDELLVDLRQQLYGFLMHESEQVLRQRIECLFTGLDHMARRAMGGERFAEDWLADEKDRLRCEIRKARG